MRVQLAMPGRFGVGTGVGVGAAVGTGLGVTAVGDLSFPQLGSTDRAKTATGK
jgi:hypothetical protein